MESIQKFNVESINSLIVLKNPTPSKLQVFKPNDLIANVPQRIPKQKFTNNSQCTIRTVNAGSQKHA